MIDHLVDSDWLIDYLLGKRRAIQVIQPLIEGGTLALPIVVYGEIYEGLVSLDTDDAALSRFHDVVAGMHVLSLDVESAEVFGRLRSELRTEGELIPDNDLWVASTALRHNLTLISRDSHFDRIRNLRLLR